MNITGWRLFAVVFFLALLLRCWGAFSYQGYAGDESIHVPAAISLMEYGTTPDWKHPQLSSFILAGTMKVFGNNAVGWRISGILLGTASVLLVYLIARMLYPGGLVPILSATLLAFDPFHIHFSRTTLMETPVTFFFLLFLYLILEYSENNRNTLLFAGIALGFTIATKAYFVFAIPVVVFFALYRMFQKRLAMSFVFLEFVVMLVLLPLSIYLLSYIKWFGRGYTASEFLQFRFDAYSGFDENLKFTYEQILNFGGKPWEWFVKPIALGHQVFSDGSAGQFIIEINNPVFRMMVFPALFLVMIYAVKKRNLQHLLPPILFASCYVLFFLVKRPMYSYSALALLPFAYLFLAHAVVIVARRYQCEKVVVGIFACTAFALECYLYPLTTGFVVSTDLYRPILSITHLTKVF